MTDDSSDDKILTVEIDAQYSNCLSPEDRFGTVGDAIDTTGALALPLWTTQRLATIMTIFLVFASLNIGCIAITGLVAAVEECCNPFKKLADVDDEYKTPG